MSDATLSLKVLSGQGRPSPYDVVARIEPIGGGSSGTVDTVVPSSADHGWDVPLDAGAYNVQLFLADGRILQRACEIEPGQILPLVFEDPVVASYGFSLQEASGTASLAEILQAAVSGRRETSGAIVEARPTVRGDRRVPMARQASVKPRIPKAASPTRTVASGQKTVARSSVPRKSGAGAGSFRVGLATSAKPAANPKSRRAIETRREPDRVRLDDANRLSVSPPGSLEGAASWERLATGPRGLGAGEWTRMRADQAADGAAIWRLPADVASGGTVAGRVWVLVRTEKAVEAVSIPAPWRCADTGVASPIDVLVDGTKGGRAGTSVAVHDRALDGLLSYLDRGRLGSVRPILDALERDGVIERTIDEKRSNPLAACAAAYVGLAVLGSSGQARWDAWLPNVMRLFPRIADGGVVHARRILLRPKTSDESGQLLEALERAFEAGVPYYSCGLLMMREMLELLEPDHARAGELLKRVAPVAARCDPRQMFTVLRYPETRR